MRGVDAGGLAIRGSVPANVTLALADCTTYRGQADGGLTYLALGLTADFREFMYPPHCRLFFIIDSTGVCEDVQELHENLMRDLMAALNRTPQEMARNIDGKAIFRDWVSGFPGTIGRPLDDSVPRMNGLPVTPFIEDVLIRELARLQADGLRQQRA